MAASESTNDENKSTDELKVGFRIDVCDSDNNWNICKILKIDKDKKQMKIHFEGWNKKYDQWIDIKSHKKDVIHDKPQNENNIHNNITTAKHRHHINMNKVNNNQSLMDYAALNTYTTKCEYLCKPKKMKNTNNSSVVYFYSHMDHRKYLIITNGYNDDNKFVNKYDITHESEMKWVPFVEYPDGFMPINNGNILGISDDTHILYMFGGKTGVFGTLNLNNGQWDILCKNMAEDMDNFDAFGVKSIWSPSMYWLNKNDLHIFGNAIEPKINTNNYKASFVENTSVSYHIKYDKTLNKCIEIGNSNQNGYKHLNNAKIIYVKHLNKFMNFSGANDIFYCDDMAEFKWNKSHVKLPGNSVQYIAVNVCEYLVFVFYLFSKHNKDIWILDLNQNTWYKSNKNCPSIDMRAKPHVINTQDGWLHFVGGHKYHFKLMIDDIIINELHNKYDKIRNALMVGYIKMIEKKYKLFTRFNDDLLRLLISYYPKFGM